MAVNYFNDDKSDNIIERVVEEVEYRLVGDKMPKLKSPQGGIITESTVDGVVKETDTRIGDLVTKTAYQTTSQELESIKSVMPDTSRAQVGQAVVYAGSNKLGITNKIIDRNAVIQHINQYVEYPETVIVKGADVTDSTYKLFPTDLIAHRNIEIVRANVSLKFNSVHETKLFRTNQTKRLTVMIEGVDGRNREYSTPLSPSTARVFTPALNRSIDCNERYNIALEFKLYGNAWEILDSAVITLFYRYK